MTLLTADQILATDDREVRDVEVPEWGGTVRVRALSGRDRDEWEASMRVTRGKKTGTDTTNLRAKLVGRAIIDESGKRAFTDQQIIALGDKSARALERLFDVIGEMSGLNDEADADAEKNSETVPSESSTSDSHETSE